MSDLAFGQVPKDVSYENLNVKKTLGQCDTKIRAGCIVADRIETQDLVVTGQETLPFAVARAFMTQEFTPGVGFLDPIILDSELPNNTPGMYNPATGIFTVPNTGTYAISTQICVLNINDGGNASANAVLYGFTLTVNGPAFLNFLGTNSTKAIIPVARNGVASPGPYGAITNTASNYFEVELNAGDNVRIQAATTPLAGTMTIIGSPLSVSPIILTGLTFMNVRQIS